MGRERSGRLPRRPVLDSRGPRLRFRSSAFVRRRSRPVHRVDFGPVLANQNKTMYQNCPRGPLGSPLSVLWEFSDPEWPRGLWAFLGRSMRSRARATLAEGRERTAGSDDTLPFDRSGPAAPVIAPISRYRRLLDPIRADTSNPEAFSDRDEHNRAKRGVGMIEAAKWLDLTGKVAHVTGGGRGIGAGSPVRSRWRARR
jgi:hypothetical protein